MRLGVYINYGLVLLLFVKTGRADVYLHNPRGSNNRLNEATVKRKNTNRLFDSQNNDQGGYNVGSLFYYTGSKLSIEWTNQHSCQNPNNHCELIIQYLCGDQVRDGSIIRTIPNDNTRCRDNNCDTDFYYGQHEDFNNYLQCRTTEKNKGLFTADQILKGESAAFTRQNPKGTQYGYECAEERDYYPYWQPSPWKDIVVMTNDVRRCPYYRKESENVKSRWRCVLPNYVLITNKNLIIPNNQKDCEKFRWPKNNPGGLRAKWTESFAHGLPPPDCRETQFTRDNHLGNGLGGGPNLYNWTIPDSPHEQCVLRIRYNISTNDYDGWNTDRTSNKASNTKEANIDMSTRYGFNNLKQARSRGYVFKNNPEIKLFDDAEINLRLAINTAQYGRTFQDRSHTFAIRQRPENLKTAAIHNLNIRGKRGNIVQVYPAVEYDFVPNALELAVGDYVHFQWTGSNSNPVNFDGEGQAQTDRSNVVLLSSQIYPEGSPKRQRFGHYGNNYPSHLSNATFLSLSEDDLIKLAFLESSQFGGDMSLLNDAGTYFNFEPHKVTQTGTYHYMSTRNNNFSNRDQKGKIEVSAFLVQYKSIGWMGGKLEIPRKAHLFVDQGVFEELHILKIEVWKVEDGKERLELLKKKKPPGDFASDFIHLKPEKKLAAHGKSFTLTLTLSKDDNIITVFKTNENVTYWIKVPAQVSEGLAKIQIDEGGTYIAMHTNNTALIVGIVIGCIAFLTIIIATVVYCKKFKKFDSITKNIHIIQRSALSKI